MIDQKIQESNNDVEKKLGIVSLHRANMYQILSKAVQYPTIELAESLLNGKLQSEIAESIEWVNGRDGMYNNSLEQLKSVEVHRTEYHPEDLLKEMEEEYTRLFLQPEYAVVSPYERNYNDKAQELLLASIEKAYDGVKSDFLPDYHCSADHIAAELSFLSYLTQQEGESWLERNMFQAKKWKIKERTFIVHHLRQWGVSFFVKLERSSELEAYKAIASVGKVFMTLEHGN
jgi:TorA maturation chaperone TorD